MHPDNPGSRKSFGLRHGFKVCTGAHYIGGFIGDDESKRNWPKKCMETWERNIHKIKKTVGKYPKESYATVVRVIKSE